MIKLKRNPFLNVVKKLSHVNSRLTQPISYYLLSLGMAARKHTQTHASEISGLNKAQFSRLLKNHHSLSKDTIESLSKDEARRIAGKKRKPLVTGAPWTVGIIIDATLHVRSSDRPQNSKCLNHGKGFIDGHEWTNIMIIVNGATVPLPPIPFYTRNECKRRGIPYKTEIESVTEFLKEFQLWDWVGWVEQREVVLIVDGGYDSGKFQRFIKYQKGWDFIGRIHSNRTSLTADTPPYGFLRRWLSVKEQFVVASKVVCPWQTVRIDKTGLGKKKKRKDFRIRQLLLFLKGTGTVKVVCSENNLKDGFRFFASSNINVSPGVICRVYLMRWQIEIFHKSVKSYLGFEHAGVKEFDSLQSHVHWVYCAYILMMRSARAGETLYGQQKKVKIDFEKQRLRELIQETTHYGGVIKLRRKFKRELDRLDAA